MIINQGSRLSVKPIGYLFVDANSFQITLSNLSKRYFDGVKLPVKWSKMQGSYRKVFYYDAVPIQNSQERDDDYNIRIAPKLKELSEIDRQPSFHVRTGDAVKRRKERGNEQKMVDVQLAVDALLMASRGLFDNATLVTGDLDFRPLVSALVEMGIDVTLVYPPAETSDYFLAAADHATPMDISICYPWLESEFQNAHPLPTASFNLGGPEQVGIKMAESDHEHFGRCEVTKIGDTLLLFTERNGINSSHKLEVKCTNAQILRCYALDTYGIELPAW